MSFINFRSCDVNGINSNSYINETDVPESTQQQVAEQISNYIHNLKRLYTIE
jgi:hypothetical protein